MLKRVKLLVFAILCLALPVTVEAAPLDEVKQYVSDYYFGDLKGNVNDAKTIDEVISYLDPYSDYFTVEEMKEFENAVNMKTVGIGVGIEQHTKGLIITQVFDGGSAKTAGLVAGDIITHVDDVSIAGLGAEVSSNKIVGPENTRVRITYLNQHNQSKTVSLVRKAFTVPNTESRLLYGQVGYIALYSFSEDAVALVRKEILALTKQGATSFIFDLQNNGGGYVMSAEQIIGLFPQARNAYVLHDNEGTALYHAERQTIRFPNATSILINRMSASASEMTAAALKDQTDVTLYGETSYGKGTMQTFIELSDGSYLKLTIAEFLSPQQNKIHKVGVTPHKNTATALVTAHYDAIVAKHPNYKKTATLTNVAPTKTFTLTLDGNVTALQQDAIELVTLGGQKVDITTTIQQNKVLIKPQKPLLSKAEYILLVHPKIQGNAKKLKKGSYTSITVK